MPLEWVSETGVGHLPGILTRGLDSFKIFMVSGFKENFMEIV